MQGVPPLGKVGLWSLELRYWQREAAEEIIVDLEKLGYRAVWVPGGVDDKILGDVDRLLSVTSEMTIATGIVNIWKCSPEVIASWWSGLSDDKRQRTLLGLGVSHGPLIGDAWKKPVSLMRDFLTELDARNFPANHLCLAALGPKMLELSGQFTAGAHPYLVTPEHTAKARSILGDDKLLAPEQGVILEKDPAVARALARKALLHYQTLPNYMNSWRRMGLAEDDIQHVTDKLVDALFVWGSAAQIAERVNDHLSAGADHVCMQVLTGAEAGDFRPLQRDWAALADEIL